LLEQVSAEHGTLDSYLTLLRARLRPSSVRLLQAWSENCRCQCVVIGGFFAHYRTMPSVSLIIPTRNQHALLDCALRSIVNANQLSPIALEILVIDNQSDDADSRQYLNDLPEIASSWGLESITVMPFDEPFNFSRMNNFAVAHTAGDVLCFLNNDIEIITTDWIHHLIDEATQVDAGCVGALLFYPNETVQHAGVITGMGTIAGHAFMGMPRAITLSHPYFKAKRVCSAVTGACLAIDLCLRVRSAGYNNIWLPQVQLFHHESLSRGKGRRNDATRARHQREIQLMQSKWGQAVDSDPYWMPYQQSWAEFWLGKSIPQHLATHAHSTAARGFLGIKRSLSYCHSDLS